MGINEVHAMILGFAHYNLRAPRPLLEELREFYTGVVGLTVGDRPPLGNFGYWLYGGGTDILHLSECAPGEERPPCVATTFDHAAFRCSDRAQVERRLAASGVEFRAAEVPRTGQVQLFFKDPAGNGVELNFASAQA
jgi:catechol 2,3-dioxygenase-like lactoylglutathione lyase family enzyme